MELTGYFLPWGPRGQWAEMNPHLSHDLHESDTFKNVNGQPLWHF